MRILVVDDEALITRYIVQCINGADGEHEVVGTAASGLKALEKIEETHPDVVLTDITMPKMDGLELLRICRERYPGMSVVMLTCHDDFEYARQAMQDHADDYVLKSEINPEFIGRKLEKVASLRKKRNADQIVGQLKQRNYLRTITDAGDRSVYLLTEHDLRESSILLREDALVALSFRNTVETVDFVLHSLPAEFENFLLHPYNERISVLLCNIKEKSSLQSLSEKEEYINAYLAALREHLDGFAGRSRVFYRLVRLPMAIDEAVAALEDRFYGAPSRTGLSRREADQGLEDLCSRARARLEEGDLPGACAAVEELLAFAGENHPDSATLIGALAQTLGSAAEPEMARDELQKRFEAAKDFPALRALVLECTVKLQRSGHRYSAAISKAVRYIGENFGDDLTLGQVADHVFLNREYLSRQFKKEVGVNFSEYLMEYRLREAMRMLRGSDLRIGEVADRVGLSNVSYFTSAFKKQYHMTPSEVRKK